MHDRFTVTDIARILRRSEGDVSEPLLFGAPPAPRFVDGSLVSWFEGHHVAWHLGVPLAVWQRAVMDDAIRRAEGR